MTILTLLGTNFPQADLSITPNDVAVALELAAIDEKLYTFLRRKDIVGLKEMLSDAPDLLSELIADICGLVPAERTIWNDDTKWNLARYNTKVPLKLVIFHANPRYS